ncbi:competence protein ComJ [Phyllobacterium sp. K27]
MLTSLSVMINYGQLIIYLPSVKRPGHLWGENELKQGFAWSPGIVSLAVPEHAFICLVEIEIANDFKLSLDAISCLRVPFDISETPVNVGSIFHYDQITIEQNKYSLIYEVLPGRGTWEIDENGEKEQGENSYVLKIWLIPGEDDSFEILKTGGAVETDKILSRLTELA